jgi:hypothetical protein
MNMAEHGGLNRCENLNSALCAGANSTTNQRRVNDMERLTFKNDIGHYALKTVVCTC